MFKLIIKNIWNRRRRNAVLLLELIIITIVAWASLDTVIVQKYVHDMPLGYDIERLVRIDFAPEDMEKIVNYDDDRENALRRFATALEALPEVEMATRTSRNIESGSFSCNIVQADTSSYHFYNLAFTPGWDLFATMGMKSIGRSPSTAELTSRTYADGEIVLSESGARAIFGDKDPIGLKFGDSDDEDGYKVVGVVSDIRIKSNESDAMVYYRPNYWQSRDSWPSLTIRLKEGVSGREFINKYRSMVERDFKGGNLQCDQIATMEEISRDYLYQSGYTNSMRLRVILAVFFLVNLCLGMVGTFLLQTRKRTVDAGIMLSFGATPGKVTAMLLGEGAVLTTIGCAIGCLIYMYIGHTIGLARGIGNLNVDARTDVPWIASFGEHFAIVSVIIYLLILATVLIGIYIPARRISRVNPVDALRDE